LPKDEECGRFLLSERYNVDSIPFNFDHNPKASFVDHKDELTQVSGTCGGDKRFGTIHLCVHADPDKPQPDKRFGTIHTTEHEQHTHNTFAKFWHEWFHGSAKQPAFQAGDGLAWWTEDRGGAAKACQKLIFLRKYRLTGFAQRTNQ